MTVDNSGYKWEPVLDETTEARGCWYDDVDREMLIIYKVLKAVRYPARSHLPRRAAWLNSSALRGRHGGGTPPRQPHLPFPSIHDIAMEVVIDPRYQRHLHSHAVHQNHGVHLG